MKTRKGIVSNFWLPISIGGFLLCYSFLEQRKLNSINWATSPYLFSFVLGFLFLLLGIRSFLFSQEKSIPLQNCFSFQYFMKGILLIIFYVLIMPYAGFFPASVLFLIFFLWLLEERNLLLLTIYPLLFPFLISILFQHLFHIMLPVGRWLP